MRTNGMQWVFLWELKMHKNKLNYLSILCVLNNPNDMHTYLNDNSIAFIQ